MWNIGSFSLNSNYRQDLKTLFSSQNAINVPKGKAICEHIPRTEVVGLYAQCVISVSEWLHHLCICVYFCVCVGRCFHSEMSSWNIYCCHTSEYPTVCGYFCMFIMQVLFVVRCRMLLVRAAGWLKGYQHCEEDMRAAVSPNLTEQNSVALP